MSISRILLAGGAISVTSAYLYARYLHQSLLNQVNHQAVNAVGRKATYDLGELETLPIDLLDHPERYRIVHDRDEKRLPRSMSLDGDHSEELFTKLTQRNMSSFARLPQSWMMRMLAKTPEQTESFKEQHLLSIDYQEGELFCGFYRVIKRSPFKVEIDMEPPPGAGPLKGRLVVSMNRRGDEAFLRTETLQWIEAGSKVVLPLERAPIRFMHEMASWWLLVSGATFLESLAST